MSCKDCKNSGETKPVEWTIDRRAPGSIPQNWAIIDDAIYNAQIRQSHGPIVHETKYARAPTAPKANPSATFTWQVDRDARQIMFEQTTQPRCDSTPAKTR
ncbi:hypothetical protein N7492_009180 [Penicillium capsulatum]|uniref:Uncharacterized protein n=1 Tax=Penicillium capsulatum TaxID=69766 RepID=A0A9W9HSG6_9EURO|nr:hypothetical protein N7492_009180 [Penicillium capsulatum]